MSGLRFRSLIHFEFIFVYGVRECSNFVLVHVAVQFFQRHLLKRLSFLRCIFLPPLSKISRVVLLFYTMDITTYFFYFFQSSIAMPVSVEGCIS